jgi:hypothetical protein
MFQIKCSVTFFFYRKSCRLLDNVDKYGTVRQANTAHAHCIVLTIRDKKERRVKRTLPVISCTIILLLSFHDVYFLQPGFTRCGLRKKNHSYAGPQPLLKPVLRTVRCGSSSFTFSILSFPSRHPIAAYV